MTTIENQFDDEPYDQSPDPNKEYWCTPYLESTGFTHLMKRVLLSNKIPLTLTDKDIREINQTNTIGWTALMLACRNSNTYSSQETVNSLITAGADLNMQEAEGRTALMMSCICSNTYSKQETVEELIKAGADLNMRDGENWTALMFTCACADTYSNQETIEALIKANADLNVKGDDGYTALMLACRYSNTGNGLKIVEALIKAGVDLNAVTDLGYSALILACKYSNHETVGALIKAGADLNIRSDDGQMALIMACEQHNISHEDETIGALIKSGADVNDECMTILSKLANKNISDLLVERFQYKPYFIRNIIDKHKLNELCYKAYIREQTCDKIVEYQDKIYSKPNNMNALLCQTNFESKRNINYCSHKLLFLFAKN